jgi:hypothetical protein
MRKTAQYHHHSNKSHYQQVPKPSTPGKTAMTRSRTASFSARPAGSPTTSSRSRQARFSGLTAPSMTVESKGHTSMSTTSTRTRSIATKPASLQRHCLRRSRR